MKAFKAAGLVGIIGLIAIGVSFFYHAFDLIALVIGIVLVIWGALAVEKHSYKHKLIIMIIGLLIYLGIVAYFKYFISAGAILVLVVIYLGWELARHHKKKKIYNQEHQGDKF